MCYCANHHQREIIVNFKDFFLGANNSGNSDSAKAISLFTFTRLKRVDRAHRQLFPEGEREDPIIRQKVLCFIS